MRSKVKVESAAAAAAAAAASVSYVGSMGPGSSQQLLMNARTLVRTVCLWWPRGVIAVRVVWLRKLYVRSGAAAHFSRKLSAAAAAAASFNMCSNIGMSASLRLTEIYSGVLDMVCWGMRNLGFGCSTIRRNGQSSRILLR